MELQNKLFEIQQKLKAPKSERNTFANFDYRSAEKILEAVKPLLGEHKLTLLLSDEVREVGDRIYVEATAEVSDGKDHIAVKSSAREELSKKGMDAAQVTGSASSYARKYALNGLFAIDDTDDPDAKDNAAKPAKTVASKLADAQDIQLMLTKAKEVSGLDTKDKVLEWFESTLRCLPNEVPKSDVAEILDEIEAERIKA